MAPSSIQYGCRDDDDDSDDGKHRRRSSKLQFLTRESSKRRLKKLSAVISDTKSLLKGASSSSGVGGHLFLYGDDDEDSSSSYESESSDSEGNNNSDDDASVCSKASVASKAGKAVKKLGGKLRSSIKLPNASGKRRGSGGKQDHLINDNDDGSVASSASRSSRASNAMRRVSLKMGKAFNKVGSNKKHVALEDFSDNSLSSCEDDLFLHTPAVTRRGPDDRAPGTRTPVTRTKSCDNSRPTSVRKRAPLSRSLTSESKKMEPLRRSLTSDWKPSEDNQDREQSSFNVESVKKNEYDWNMNVPPSLVLDSVTFGGNIRAA